MAFYYVKNGGTATADAGRETTERTGTFESAGNNYDSIAECFDGTPTTAPASGDEIRVSNSHNKAHSGSVITIGISDSVTVVSVDNANQENYLKGAVERVTSTHNLRISDTTADIAVFSKGVDYYSGNDLFISNGSNQIVTLEDCLIKLTGTSGSDEITSPNDGVRVVLNDVDMEFGNTNQSYELSNSYLQWNGGTLQSAIAYLFETSGSNSRGAQVTNVVLTNLTSAVTKILAATGSDLAVIEIDSCILASGIVLDDTSSTFARNVSIIGSSVGIGTGASLDTYHYFQKKYYQGDIQEETSIYRTAGATYDGTNEYSAEMVSNANTTYGNPLKFGLASVYIDTDNYTTDITFKVHFSRDDSTTALNDDEFWIEVEHPDGVDNALGVLVSTRREILDTGAAHTSETSLWTGLTGSFKEMSDSITITIGTSAGNIATGAVYVNCYLVKASQTMFVCPEIEIT